MELRAGIVDDGFLLADRQLKLDDLRPRFGRLFARMHGRGRDQRHALARQLDADPAMAGMVIISVAIAAPIKAVLRVSMMLSIG
jgi:hypothetical protein